MASDASKILLPGGVPAGKLVHLALPVRLTPAANGGRGATELACTFDIHPGGARLLSSREVSGATCSPSNVGEARQYAAWCGPRILSQTCAASSR